MTSPAKAPRHLERQRGTVLILAILIVALVAGFAIKASRDYQFSIARAEARWHGAQAEAYLSGAERLAIYFLELDENPEVDSLLEPWAMELPPFPIEGGMILAQIEDASARFNLNTIGTSLNNTEDNNPNSPARFNTAQKHFLRLLQSFPEIYPVSPEEAIAILEALVDWTDSDHNITGFMGAERDYYLALDPAYQPANTPLTSVDELRLVRYMTPELMQLLRPFITVIPAGEDAGGGFNVNTIPSQLLRTFNSDDILTPLTVEEASTIVSENGEYATVEEFTENTAWDSIISSDKGIDAGLVQVNTQHFLVTTRVQLGEQRRSRQSLLQRSDESFDVVHRRDVYDYILSLEQAPAPSGQQEALTNP
ncbi:type II secretion system minor pseudopilin GspK [Gilvimarinus agarilyticus]|uniref:type II secretion system minor pseudopilin GspK n=1 Tax=unclassified Gilvimarinus TaxID=2642066 RepID=UPI001C0953EC|nr:MULTISPECIES: type II secretion system minor pseudopilin GspK [unclassified Gilvimarinus]MBU2886243.1 type II secretion system minor pseudopilin GspK [Gilvimarinus agarilyticus]MDO6570931.1 type II secretion system minor pseudopilin GspK [Gilvimarinus sp. 2_MG-2023]MDO6747782.1 type II secretion system minor pseudopilin GspK [Gilvimarinus sp. 1_MG-2023]